MKWQEEFEAELERGEEARRKGNEGRARVCARRAAGIVVRERFSVMRRAVRSTSTVDLLNQLYADPDLSADMRPLVEHLTTRVDEEFKLPVGVDLLADARRLRELLLPIGNSGP